MVTGVSPVRIENLSPSEYASPFGPSKAVARDAARTELTRAPRMAIEQKSGVMFGMVDSDGADDVRSLLQMNPTMNVGLGFGVGAEMEKRRKQTQNHGNYRASCAL